MAETCLKSSINTQNGNGNKQKKTLIEKKQTVKWLNMSNIRKKECYFWRNIARILHKKGIFLKVF